MSLTEGQIRYRKYKVSYTNYRRSHKNEKRESEKKGRNIRQFNGLRDEVLARDNYSCRNCGMTQEEHLERWKVSLTIDHIDGQGRYSSIKNNSLDNLKTLCLKCHGKKDRNRYLAL